MKVLRAHRDQLRLRAAAIEQAIGMIDSVLQCDHEGCAISAASGQSRPRCRFSDRCRQTDGISAELCSFADRCRQMDEILAEDFTRCPTFRAFVTGGKLPQPDG